MPTITCTITISEIDGKLSIEGHIPDNAQNSIAGELASKLLEGAVAIMNTTLDEDKELERQESH